ncbi:hypothetical protein AKJ09_08242 [Labilithrix luteola]|uniref:Uncharacterized protein n=1 Tax=Labilithrix luteola TaxID=1391654 RepID=A0A0K1Q777_9BACT|nr:hypothetical protein AKJ09_08242 [Labilithrix luteola]
MSTVRVPTRGREIEAARALLTPEGIAIISTSYRNEAGAATLLKSRLGSAAEVKSLLASVVVDKKKTLASFVNERISHGERLGVLEDERAQLRLAATESSAVANVNARNAWIRAVNALIANAELAGISPEHDATILVRSARLKPKPTAVANLRPSSPRLARPTRTLRARAPFHPEVLAGVRLRCDSNHFEAARDRLSRGSHPFEAARERVERRSNHLWVGASVVNRP